MANNRNNQGTGFTNFNDILNANQGSGQRMGQAVAGGLESQANAVNQNLGQQQGEFNTGYNKAQTDWNNQSALASRLAEQGTANTQTPDANWQNIAGQTGDTTDYTKAGNDFRNFNYTGPTGFKNATGLQAQAQSAAQAGNLANTAQGQQQLLRQYVGGNGYNQGQSQFDQALLNKYGHNDINQAKKGLSGINQQANTAITNASQAAQTEGNLIKGQQQDYGKQINNALRVGSSDFTGGTGTGLLGAGEANKAATTADIARTQQLLATGTGGSKNIDPSTYSQHDKDLLNNLAQNWQGYGVDTNKDYYNYAPDQQYLDTTSAPQALSGVQNIANQMSVNGNYLLDPTQQKAATNLSSFLGSQITPDQYTDLSKTFNGNLQNIIDTHTGVTEKSAEDRLKDNQVKGAYWSNLVGSQFDPGNNSPTNFDEDHATFGGYDAAAAPLDKNAAFQDANARSIAEFGNSLYSGKELGQMQNYANRYQNQYNMENNAYNTAKNQKLLDYLKGLGVNSPSTSNGT